MRIRNALSLSQGQEKIKKNRIKVMDNSKIDKIIDKYQGKPGSLIHVLMEIQEENHWLPREVLVKISEKLEVPLSRVRQIATFYKTFSLKPQGRHEIHVCMGTSCHIRGSQQILEKVQDLTGIKPGETDADLKFSLEQGNCLGCCSLGPEMIVDGTHYPRMTPEKVEELLNEHN
jgi:NADH-quinone oxidoreductase subunit E